MAMTCSVSIETNVLWRGKSRRRLGKAEKLSRKIEQNKGSVWCEQIVWVLGLLTKWLTLSAGRHLIRGYVTSEYSQQFKFMPIKWTHHPIAPYILTTIRWTESGLGRPGFQCDFCWHTTFAVCSVSGVISRCFLSSSPDWGRRQGLGNYRFQLRFNEIPVKSPIKKLCMICTSQGVGGAGRGMLELFYDFFLLKTANLPLNHLITN